MLFVMHVETIGDNYYDMLYPVRGNYIDDAIRRGMQHLGLTYKPEEVHSCPGRLGWDTFQVPIKTVYHVTWNDRDCNLNFYPFWEEFGLPLSVINES